MLEQQHEFFPQQHRVLLVSTRHCHYGNNAFFRAQLSVNLEWLYISNKWISISMHYDWLLKLGISSECPLVNLQNIVDAHEINHLHSQVLSRKIVQQAVLWTCTPMSPKIIWIPWETFWNIKMKVLYWKIVNVSYLLCAGTEIYSRKMWVKLILRFQTAKY